METILYFRSYNNFNATRKQEGVYRAAREFGWNIQIIDTGCDTSAGKVKALIDLWHPAGILIESGAGTPDLPLSTFGGTPVVFIDRDPEDLRGMSFCVVNDSAANARLAAQELLARPPVSYAYVPWRLPLFWCREREQAFRDILDLHGRRLERFTGKDDPETGSYSGAELATWLLGLPHPIGILCANDYIGQQVLAAAARVGLSVPGDLLVVGIDDEEIICENTCPTLTSIRPDFEGLGEQGARLLDRVIRCPDLRPTVVRIGPVKVVRRQSSRCLRMNDPVVGKAVEHIRLNACNGLTAQEVLAMFPVARRQAEIRFRQALGHSILDEIQRVRLERAKDLLAQRNELPMAALANFCGYSSASALYKIFVAHTGMSPRQWRTRKSLP